MKKPINVNAIIYTCCILAILWSIGLAWRFISPRLELGIAEQRKIYSSEMTVYLDDKPLPPCSEDIETRVCIYSCAPDGVCVFVPSELIKQYNFGIK
jgi:hypothetical protein